VKFFQKRRGIAQGGKKGAGEEASDSAIDLLICRQKLKGRNSFWETLKNKKRKTPRGTSSEPYQANFVPAAGLREETLREGK